LFGDAEAEAMMFVSEVGGIGLGEGKLRREPEMHAGMRAEKGGAAQAKDVAGALRDGDCGPRVVRAMGPSECGTDPPLALDGMRLVWAIGKKEACTGDIAKLNVLCAASGLRVGEGAVGYELFDVEESGVCGVETEEEIGRAGAGLEAGRKAGASGIAKVALASGELWSEGHRRLRGAALGIAAKEAVLDGDEGVTEAGAAGGRRTRKMERDGFDGNEDHEIEIAMKAPGKRKAAFVSKRWTERGGVSGWEWRAA